MASRTPWPGAAIDLSELALSEWGRWDDELPPDLLAPLVWAYLRRKRWEARVLARALKDVLPAGPPAVVRVPAPAPGEREPLPGEAERTLAHMGVKCQ